MPMHSDDLRALEFRFDPSDHAEDREHRIADALGIDLNAVRALGGAIVADLQWPNHGDFGDVERVEVDSDRFGITWWTGYTEIGVGRRLLVADYLIETVDAIETNLLEARLHLSNVRSALAEPAPERGSLVPQHYLRGTTAQLHIGGMLRAVGSVVDCVGTSMIGVLGLGLPLKRGDFGTVKRWLVDRAPRLPPSPALGFQIETCTRVCDAFESPSPTGWLDWVSGFRNTFVHRGRRHQQWQAPVGLRLPAAPDHSELEARLASPYPEALNESCEETLSGVMANVQRATFEACTLLLAAWQRRRAEPDFIHQPREQWRDDPPLGAGAAFAGFATRELEHTPVVVTSPKTAKRCAATAVDRRLMHLWRTFG